MPWTNKALTNHPGINPATVFAMAGWGNRHYPQRGESRWIPHQSTREMQRRVRQMAKTTSRRNRLKLQWSAAQDHTSWAVR